MFASVCCKPEGPALELSRWRWEEFVLSVTKRRETSDLQAARGGSGPGRRARRSASVHPPRCHRHPGPVRLVVGQESASDRTGRCNRGDLLADRLRDQEVSWDVSGSLSGKSASDPRICDPERRWKARWLFNAWG